MKAKPIKPRPKQVKGQSDLSHLEDILKLMEKYEVIDLEWEKRGERIKLSTRAQNLAGRPQICTESPVVRATTPAQDELQTASAVEAKKNSSSANASQKQVASPFVGTFYRSASPDAAPYVKEGQTVKRGDVLCIIEAMKLMNEIEAEFPGRIISVLVENGQPVEFGEPLFMVEV